jgi:hypothetical protein
MNINTYLPGGLADRLDRLAEARGLSRSAVMREALEAYLRRNQPGGWPDEILEWQGDPEIEPFEALRPVVDSERRDPFDDHGE